MLPRTAGSNMMVLFKFLPTMLINSLISAFLKLAEYSVADTRPALIAQIYKINKLKINRVDNFFCILKVFIFIKTPNYYCNGKLTIYALK